MVVDERNFPVVSFFAVNRDAHRPVPTVLANALLGDGNVINGFPVAVVDLE